MTCTQCCNQGRECVCDIDRQSTITQLLLRAAIKREREAIAAMIDAHARKRETGYPYHDYLTAMALYDIAQEIRDLP